MIRGRSAGARRWRNCARPGGGVAGAATGQGQCRERGDGGASPHASSAGVTWRSADDPMVTGATRARGNGRA
jgi:hypothetical protein